MCLRSFSNLFSTRGNTFARMCLLARSRPQLRMVYIIFLIFYPKRSTALIKVARKLCRKSCKGCKKSKILLWFQNSCVEQKRKLFLKMIFMQKYTFLDPLQAISKNVFQLLKGTVLLFWRIISKITF